MNELNNFIPTTKECIGDLVTRFAMIHSLVDDHLIYSIDKITISVPIELNVAVNEDGIVRLTSSPPSQQIETSFMPVFHQLGMVINAETINE